MANNYFNLPLRRLYAELQAEHNQLMQSLKMAGPKEVSKQVIENIKEIMNALNLKVHAFSENAQLNITGE